MAFPPDELVDRLVDEVPLVTAIQWHDTATSTNALALEAAAAGAPAGLVVGAEQQTAGRGRRGRSWFAPPGTSLLLSLLVRPSLPPASRPVLTLAAGTALHRAVDELVDDAGLKWPNDLLIGGVKAGGILTEAAGDTVVIGIGLNVDWRGVTRPADFQATSVVEAAGRDVDRAPLLASLLAALGEELAVADGHPGEAVRRYVPRCATVGTTVVARGVEHASGTAVGLTPDGHLRITTNAGTEITVSSGEVEHLR